jgi:hypothetical protein
MRKIVDVRHIIKTEKDDRYPVLSCENHCLSLEGIIDSSVSSVSPTGQQRDQIEVVDFINYYDLAMTRGMSVSFNYESSMEKFLNMVDKEKQKIRQDIQKLEYPNKEISDLSFLYSYISVLDQYTILLFENKIGQVVSAHFNDEFTILEDDIAEGLDRLYLKVNDISTSDNSDSESEKESSDDSKNIVFLINKVKDYYNFFSTY